MLCGLVIGSPPLQIPRPRKKLRRELSVTESIIGSQASTVSVEPSHGTAAVPNNASGMMAQDNGPLPCDAAPAPGITHKAVASTGSNQHTGTPGIDVTAAAAAVEAVAAAAAAAAVATNCGEGRD